MNIKMMVGLGNIGSEYEHTRHNVGFWFMDALAAQWHVSLRPEKKFFGDVARVSRSEGEIWLLKPSTYMNLSGKAVAALAQFYKIAPEQILVIHDELDIPCGQIRFKQGGGNGGHNGLKDIQAQCGTPNFYRLRLGIDHPGDRNLVISYVLNKPTPTERDLIDNSITKSLRALPDILSGKKEEAVRYLHSKTV